MKINFRSGTFLVFMLLIVAACSNESARDDVGAKSSVTVTTVTVGEKIHEGKSSEGTKAMWIFGGMNNGDIVIHYRRHENQTEIYFFPNNSQKTFTLPFSDQKIRFDSWGSSEGTLTFELME